MKAVTHLEKVITGEASAVTHFEKVIAEEVTAVTYTEKVIAGEATPITHLEKVIAGIASPVTHLEQVWAGGSPTPSEHEYTGAVPISFTADGTPLLDYTIYGNMGQTGTPTQDSPIQPQETGERTENLFDMSTVENGKGIAAGGSITNYAKRCSTITPIDVSTYSNVVISFTATLARTKVIYALFDDSTLVTRQTAIFSGTTIDVSSGNKLYICFYDPGDIETIQKSDLSNVMLNSGTTALPYEPYGIKIPVETSEDILVNNLTSQEYNGLTLTKNPDGSVRVQGTATANVNFCLYNNGYTLTTDAYQVIENGVYYVGGGIEGNEEGRFYLSARYDDAIGGAPSQLFRIPYGESIRIDNSNGEYKYLAVYLAVWRGATVDFTCKPYLKAVSATNNIYLGEVQTTRKIVKRTFNGSEPFSLGSVIGQIRFNTGLTLIDNNAICSHYILKETYSSTGKPYIRLKSNTIWFELDDTGYETKEACLADFITYLQQQYAAGTPVCVWYVLATETTGIVNEPLRKIGDYADTISMEQAGVQIPTNRGNTVIDVLTELKPSEMYIKYQE